jgi:predicted transcriptional regulator
MTRGAKTKRQREVTKVRVAVELALRVDPNFSQADLARDLGVTRSAVNQHVMAIRRDRGGSAVDEARAKMSAAHKVVA